MFFFVFVRKAGSMDIRDGGHKRREKGVWRQGYGGSSDTNQIVIDRQHMVCIPS